MSQGSKSLKQWCDEHGEFGAQVDSEYMGIDAEGNKHDINNIPYGSNVELWWRCSKGHEWTASVNNRTAHKSNCPHCAKINRSKNRTTEKNSFYTWCQNNGEIGNKFLSEYTGIDEEGNKHDINDISYGSHTKMLWRCSKGHEWTESVARRTYYRKKKCPYCNPGNGTSYPEQFIYWAFKQIFSQTISRGKHGGYEYDIVVPEIATCIEYSPTRWHEGNQERDKAKAEYCKAHKANFIYIMEDSDDQYEETWTKNFICFHMPETYEKKKQACIKLVDYLLNLFNHSISEINIDLVEKNALQYSKGKIEYEKSLAYLYPDLAKEWHPTLNSIKPDEITKGSTQKIYWQCPNCAYGSQGEWQVAVNDRVSYKTGCPCCGYNYTDGKCHKPAIKIASKNNNLKNDFPELAKEWHQTLNQINPDEITKGSNISVYWQCPNCGYGSQGEWQAPPYQRVSNKTGCPCCGYNYTDGKCNKHAIKKASKDNNLKNDLPELAKEWHPTLNQIQPDEITKGSGKVIYWQCPNCGYGSNGEWKATPYRRTAKGYETGCPCCGYSWHRAMLGAPQKLRKSYINKATKP